MRRDALETRADRGMRAYVTGGAASNDAREAPCVRATASRHVVWASSMARGTLAARRPRAAPPVGGDLGVGLG